MNVHSYFGKRPRIIAIGDVHGDLGRLTYLMKSLHLINEKFQWIAEPKNTWVIQLGDQVDSKMRSGESGNWETTADVQVVFFMRNIDREAMRHGGRVISLLGNHELMNSLGDTSYVSTKSMNMLGGYSNRVATFAPGGYMAKILAERPVIVQIGSFVFCHAGLLPHHLNHFTKINLIMRKYLLKIQLNESEQRIFHELFVDNEGILWTRALLTEDYRNNILPQVLAQIGSRVMIVGHNVMPDGITTTNQRNLWFVDTAMSRAFENGHIEALEILNDGVPSFTEPNPVRSLKIK